MSVIEIDFFQTGSTLSPEDGGKEPPRDRIGLISKPQGSEHHQEFGSGARFAGVRPKGPKWKPQGVPVDLCVSPTPDPGTLGLGPVRSQFWLKSVGTLRAGSTQKFIHLHTGSTQKFLIDQTFNNGSDPRRFE